MKGFGCFIDEPGEIYNDCVLDHNRPQDCTICYRNAYISKGECSYWREIKEPFKFVDRNDIESIEIAISADKKTLWVNTEKGCILRLQNIKKLFINKME